MWRLYTRHRDAKPEDLDDVGRAAWSACHTVYCNFPPEWQGVLCAYYRPTDRHDANHAVDVYCNQHGLLRSVAMDIIWTARARAAEERGLIIPNTSRKFSDRLPNRTEV